MTYNEKKSLYENIMTDVSKIIKQRLNEASVPVKSWDAIFTYDNIAHLMFGVSISELGRDEYRGVQDKMKETIDFISLSQDRLDIMGISVTIKRNIGEIEFNNINEQNIIDFTEFFITILNSVGEAYITDFEDCIDYYDISDTLENSNPQLYSQFEQLISDGLLS